MQRFHNRSLVLCGSLLLLAAAAGAQAPGSLSGGQQPSMSSPQTPSQQTNAPSALPEASASTDPQSMNDKDFVHTALQGGAAEVELGQLAQQKGQSEDVKQFGAKMVEDHSQMGDKLFKPLAKQMGVSEPKGLSHKDKDLKSSLAKLSGNDFDQAYIKAMLKDHKQDLKDFKTEASMTQDPNLKKAAEEGQTVIEHHLKMIEQIAQKHDVAMNQMGK